MARYVELPWTPLYTQSSASSHGAAVGASSSSSTSPFSMYALAGTIAFTACVYALEAHLDSRQKRSYQKTRFPQELEETVSAIDVERAAAAKDGGSSSQSTQEEDSNNKGEKKQVDDNKPLLPQLREKFSKAQAYGLDKISFGMVASSYDTMETIAFLMLGYFPYCWDASARIGREYLGYDETEHEIKVSLVFLLITTLVSTITSLPFELYSTFQIERKHGFNTQTVGLFVSDKVKSLLLTIAIGGPFSAVLLHIIKWGGQYFYVYVWGFMFCFSVLMITIIPIWIMPLFNKYDPLPESPLKTRIFELAGQLNYPLTKLFVMDGSKRSSHSNAFMFGFWKNKRIVLFDTLLKQVTESEILAILGHELGHWKLSHTLFNFVQTQLYVGAAFYCFSRCFGSDDLYTAFGFDDPNRIKPTIIALLLFFQSLWAPVDKILSFLLTVNSRMNEFAADKFSVDLGMSKNLQSGLTKIHLENLGAMCPDPWYSTYHYSHPPLVERLSAMMALDKKTA